MEILFLGPGHRSMLFIYKPKQVYLNEFMNLKYGWVFESEKTKSHLFSSLNSHREPASL
jgi:hypothetical protein